MALLKLKVKVKLVYIENFREILKLVSIWPSLKKGFQTEQKNENSFDITAILN